jgi:Tfp pilus assembly protein PilO
VSATRHALALVLMLSVLGGMGWFGLLMPRFDSIDAAERKEIRLKDEYKTLKGQSINLDLYKQQLPTLDERFGALVAVLPSVARLWSAEEQQEVERKIGSLAQSLGMQAPKITAGPTAHEEHLATRRYQIVAAGDFRQLVRFLQGISTGSGQFWSVQHAALQPAETGSGLTLVAALQAHGFVHPETLAAWKKEKK